MAGTLPERAINTVAHSSVVKGRATMIGRNPLVTRLMVGATGTTTVVAIMATTAAHTGTAQHSFQEIAPPVAATGATGTGIVAATWTGMVMSLTTCLHLHCGEGLRAAAEGLRLHCSEGLRLHCSEGFMAHQRTNQHPKKDFVIGAPRR